MKHFKGFGNRSAKLHAKLDANMLLNFAIHRRQNETQSQKNTCVKTKHVHSVVSCGRLMQQTCGSVTLAPLLSSFSEAVTTITDWELSDSTSCHEYLSF
jgi:hypothetical protein